MFGALGRIPSGIFVLTACHGAAETGMLSSWVQQCSFTPPLISIAIRNDRFLADWLLEGASFTLNVLDDSQTDMIGHFGKGFSPDEDAFADLELSREESSAPVLSEALAFLNCRVEARYAPGDHWLIVARVV